MASARPEAAPAAQPRSPRATRSRRPVGTRPGHELARANKLFEDKKYAEALTVYQNIRTTYGDVLTPEQATQLNANVAAGQQAMTAAATATPGAQPGGAVGAFQQNKSIAKQQTLAEFNNYMMEADKALKQSNIDQARRLAANAELRINEKKGMFGEPELADLKGRVDLLQAVAKAGDALTAKNAAEITKKLQDEARLRQEGESAAKAQKIREHIDRVRQLQSSATTTRPFRSATRSCSSTR